jgi:hypothetical protein
MNEVKVKYPDGDKILVSVCAFCDRWRDSLLEWIDPPEIVSPMAELGIIDLSHTYCPPCLRENSAFLGGYGESIADTEEAKADAMKGQDYAPDDFVHNALIMTAGRELQTIPTP